LAVVAGEVGLLVVCLILYRAEHGAGHPGWGHLPNTVERPNMEVGLV
jgi:hypothetical protein